MERLVVYILCTALLCSCSAEQPDPEWRPDQAFPALSHDMIVLGDRLENPYEIENIRDAFISLYPTRSRSEVKPSHKYVRFLPADDDEFSLLVSTGLDLFDHPVDYRILTDGDYYHDPEIGDEEITWQYAVVPEDFRFPDIRHEVIDECFITEHDMPSRSGGDIDWDAVEREAYRRTGNDSLLVPQTRGGAKVKPSGRITIVDEHAYGGKPFGLAGVRVQCRTFVKISSCYTDRDGYYEIPQTYSSELRYRLVFKNEKGFAIGFNLLLMPASSSTLGKGPAEGINFTVTPSSDQKLFLRAAVSSAAYDFYSRCTEEDMGILPPPDNLRFWLFPKMSESSALMIHHDALVSEENLRQRLGFLTRIIALFAPDITVGMKGMNSYRDVYRCVCHELAHACHFSEAGTDYWNRFVAFKLKNALSSAGTEGIGSGEDAGYCAVAEMWAYYMESAMFKDRYGGVQPQFGNSSWFSPQIFRYLDDRGFSRSDFLDVMGPEVRDVRSLEDAMVRAYPRKAGMIRQVFARYR